MCLHKYVQTSTIYIYLRMYIKTYYRNAIYFILLKQMPSQSASTYANMRIYDIPVRVRILVYILIMPFINKLIGN